MTIEKKDWNILLVDDEEEFINTLAERMELRGIPARVCHNGVSALASIQENPPQVVVLDLMMPGLNGTEVLQRIHTEFPAIQVILLTGQGKGQKDITNTQAFAHLAKPLDLEKLIQTLTAAIQTEKGNKGE